MELRLNSSRIKSTAKDVIEDMNGFDSVVLMQEGDRKAECRLETPTRTQSEVLSAFGHVSDANGVLR